MATPESQLKANKKYHAKFERMSIRVSSADKALIEQHAEKMQESVNAFIKRAIQETILHDNSDNT